MSASIRTRIVRIGNFQGIRIPKALLEQSGISSEIEIEVQGDQLMIRAASQSRDGWDTAFASVAEGDDRLIEQVNTTHWDQVEWEW